MPNNYFQFKQFTIYQDRCALKVSTDSCVFGAWIAKKAALSQHHINSCLDIGAGTGLLMLMMAQQFAGNIQGVEIDKASCEQATENLKSSPWAHRLQLFNTDVKLFKATQQYDLIISNPPFFEGDLKSVNTRYNFAKHSDGLTLEDLLEVVDKNLSPQGSFAVLLPYHRMEWFQQLAASSYELFVTDMLLMKQSLQHPHFRAVLVLQRQKSKTVRKEELVIRRSADVYTYGFIELLKEYYLHL